MNLALPLIQNADLKGKVVLVRVDHNVVKKGIIHDPYRIDATIGTLYHINAKGGKIILMTHVGRPKDKKTGEITIDGKTSVEPIVEYLQKKLHIKLRVPEFYQHEKMGYIGIETSINHLIRELKDDKIDGIYMPNTRWFRGEEAKGEEQDRFAHQLAGLADIFVNDAFGSWQAHASTVGVAKYLPSYAGFLMQKEIESLERIYQPQRPFLAVVAGSKFDTKIEPLYALLKSCDYLILGGVLYNAYLCAKYDIQIAGIAQEDIDYAKKFVEYAQDYPGKLVEISYIVESDTLDGKIEGKYRTHNIHDLKPGTKLNYVLDAAKEALHEPSVEKIILSAKMIFVNAVMGFAPYFTEGTIALDELIDQNRDAIKLYGGGDTMQELKRLLPGLYIMALDNPKYYIFTGGGAVLKAIQEGTTSGIEPIKALLKQ
ncbi:MAG: phosphoglycerate kinase [Bacteroidetes bacterium RIFOXYA12_FULL_35_11]|nr:MAG: phosphoglycerate kinase [Bacteroidetes bacterium GWF2_35_48]OFY72996.1 MAG: phosphoglycerate kinase [Bacteroidetes bacterium RIFOXYA12_FULL_35_11]OFY92099.1 MAG: phosphoglycerate kinase [Bacteroidetes bacterium RIFOXYB2_FULL_35_7]OFY93901.1 MAG: phosphoglycerate kinase [Bacteroidetes bacterium RIFOXYC12_FULL_35_7]